MHVCVMGAGIVGLSTAYALTQKGHRVTVIDQAEAGQLTAMCGGDEAVFARVKPVIDCRLPMTELPAAYARMGTRLVRGKVVLENL